MYSVGATNISRFYRHMIKVDMQNCCWLLNLIIILLALRVNKNHKYVIKLKSVKVNM